MTEGSAGIEEERAQPFVWLDVSLIEQEHDRIVRDDPELQHHLELIHRSMEFLNAILQYVPYEQGSEEVEILRFGVRVFNSGGAALHLARGGFFQPALSMVRDLTEIMFLVDLFRRDRSELRDWVNLDQKKRADRFKMFNVRTRLDALDGATDRKRVEAYKLLSNFAAHVSPEGFSVISPNSQTMIGPFPLASLLKATLQELVRVQIPAIIYINEFLRSEAPEIKEPKAAFARTLAGWRQHYSF
jgi:hypothetical protein